MTLADPSENWLNPGMLRWAREWRAITLEEAATKVKKTPEQIEGWERGQGAPTVKQARTLMQFYGRPFLELMFNAPPAIKGPQEIQDYRMRAGKEPPRETRETLELQQWVETQRVNALDLFSEIGETPPNLPEGIFTTIGADPEKAAVKARDAIGFTPQEQMALAKSRPETLPTLMRRRLEASGVLTLRKGEMKKYGIRGVCLALFPLPTIAFSSEAPSGQAFTLGHEFGHILLRESGITGARASYSDQPVERWCDRFAAAFLMPVEQMRAIAGPPPNRPAVFFPDEELARLAETFRVSKHAMLIRLVHLGYVEASYYWDVKKPEFDAAEQDYKSFGRSQYYGSRYKNSQGDLYTSLVLEAWSSGRITDHNAAEFMGITTSLSHLYDIRDNFAP